MPMSPETSVVAGLATATLVYGVYSAALPPVADVRVAESNNPDVQAAERLASWTAAGIVSGVALITKEPTIFIMGGAMVVILAWWHRHADQVSPLTGKAVGQLTAPVTQEEMGGSNFGYDGAIESVIG